MNINMKKIGFDLENEFIPSFDKFHSDVNKRIMFLKLFNQEFSSSLEFSKEEIALCKELTLFDIFVDKIIKNLQFDAYIRTPIKIIDVKRTNKINNFLKKLHKNSLNFSMKNSFFKSNIKKAEALIDILEESNFSFYLDAQKIFKNFVSNKILKSNENKEIKVDSDSIEIKSDIHMFNTKIFTFWEFLDSNDLKIDTHIKKAIECIKTTEFKQVYLVYPKNENFNRHIKINCDNQIKTKEYEIKLIPYSLRSTLR